MIGLRIDCRLAGPWMPPAFGLHLDGLLGWALVEQYRREAVASHETSEIHKEADDEPQIDYASILAQLPLQRDEMTGAWCASQFAAVGWAAQERRYLTAKTPVESMCRWINAGRVEAKGGSKIDTVRGIAKNGQAFFTIEHAAGLRAWCVGDPEEIVQLLNGYVHAVGVKTRIGLGALIEGDDGSLWSVVEDDEAHKMWRHRSMPAKVIDDSYPAIGSWQPPYWRGSDLIWRPKPMRIPALVAEGAPCATSPMEA